MVVDDYSELLGYAASFVVLVSMALPSARWLRIVNLVGAVLFMAYGLAIEAWPIVVFNTLIAVLDIYYLVKLRRDAPPSAPSGEPTLDLRAREGREVDLDPQAANR